MEELYQNKPAFLNEKPKELIYFSFIILGIIGVIFFIFSKVDIFEQYITKGYVNCSENCEVIVAIPTEIKIQKIKVNKKEWNPEILSKRIEIDEEQVISYYVYTFSNNQDFQDKEIVEFTFYYNKQRILKKFIKMIF